jgi:DNA-binding transcriptional ArsR family regulator
MVDRDFILAPATVTVSFRLDPVLCALDELMLMFSDARLSGVSAWVEETRAAMTPEQRHRNALVIEGASNVLLPERDWASFAAYVDDLAARDPEALRDEAIEMLCDADKQAAHGMQALARDTLLTDLDAFLAYHEAMHAKQRAEYPELEIEPFDRAFYTELHDLYRNPLALRELIVSHLRDMWDAYLAADWAQHAPMLQEAVDAFRQLEYRGQTAVEAIRAVTGRNLSVWESDLARTERLVFVPSAHIGPYVRLFILDDAPTAYVTFGARLPEGTRVASPALSRSELLVRLSALADDTRLQILELLTHGEELCAQDIMTKLNLSQSSASRHLRQLTATGYLLERRREVAKCYSLNPARVDDTLTALRRFFRATSQTTPPAGGRPE